MVLSGKRYQEFWGDGGQTPKGALDFYDLKGVVEALLADLHLPGVTYRPAKLPALHPGKGAEVVANDASWACWANCIRRSPRRSGWPAGRSWRRSWIWRAAQARPPRFAYTPVPRFPAALRDVAVIVEESVPAERVAAEIRAAGGALLREVRLFDLYRGDSIPAGTKSLAYALTYLADDRTLTDKEVDRAHKSIEGRLAPRAEGADSRTGCLSGVYWQGRPSVRRSTGAKRRSSGDVGHVRSHL